VKLDSTATAAASRPLVAALFVASCLLSVVSWYTTQQGMALYLSPWLSVLASLGVQTALVMVAWLSGVSQARRGLLTAVYVVTALVSIAFSYVSLYTWFSARERPAAIQRRLYDALDGAAGQARERLAAAIAEGEKHVLALQELTEAEKSHGYVARAEDADPYLDGIRQAVAREAESYSAVYGEGVGGGLRYTAFDRYARLARQSLARLRQAQQALGELRARAKPLEASEGQLREFRQVFDAIPWNEVRDTLHGPSFELPAIPAYSDFVDRSASSQEDLVVAIAELVTAPGSRNVSALALAAFIDVIVFLLAYASGPLFFGAPEDRWLAAAAALDSADTPVFVRDLLRKLEAGQRGLAAVLASALSPGERQLLLLLAGRGLASPCEADGRPCYLLEASFHQHMVESLAGRSLALAAAPQPARG
jgi:hypothetical protein